MYSLLTELSQLWKSTDNPILREPMRVRNVPFYSIEVTVVPAQSSRTLNRTRIAVYLTLLLEGLVSHVATSIWPGPLSCSLEINPLGLEIGKMDVNMIPISALGSDTNSTERNISLNSNANGAAWENAGNAKLQADDIDVHQVFTGTVTTDRNMLYLFTKLLFLIFEASRWLRVPTLIQPVRTLLVPLTLFHSHIGETKLTTHAPLGKNNSRHQNRRWHLPNQNANVPCCRSLGIHNGGTARGVDALAFALCCSRSMGVHGCGHYQAR